jgi:hypothetical protein
MSRIYYLLIVDASDQVVEYRATLLFVDRMSSVDKLREELDNLLLVRAAGCHQTPAIQLHVFKHKRCLS